MLYYITGNENKIDVARKFLDRFGVSFIAQNLDISELQSESIEEVVTHKAKEAFKKINKPLFVNDHFWAIPALNGFPGAYMKYINKWFKSDDLLNLMASKTDRTAILTEMICYIDKDNIKTFKQSHKGEILQNSQGKGPPGLTTISISGDRVSIARKLEDDPSALEKNELWEEFASWYKKLK